MNLDTPILRGDIFSVGDVVLFKDHEKEKLSPQYNETYRVLHKTGDKMVDIINNRGDVQRATFPQLKKITPMEALITKVPMNLRFGRQAKYFQKHITRSLERNGKRPSAGTKHLQINPRVSTAIQNRFPKTMSL